MFALGSSRGRWVVGVATGSLLLAGLLGCGGGTVATVTVTDTATVTASAAGPATAASSTSGSARPTAASSAPAASTTNGAATSAVPTSAAQETILTVRLQAYDPATGTLSFVPQEVVETEGDAPAVLSDPASRPAPSTAIVTAQTNIKFADHGTDITAALAANEVYCTMVLQGNQVTWLWELSVT